MGIHLHILALIALIPVAAFFLFYHPSGPFYHTDFRSNGAPKKPSLFGWVWVYLASLAFTYVYMNLIVHQVGFYELFFTDIMQGNEEAQQIVTDFLTKYGRKHRHFGHGAFHGAINGILVVAPIILLFSYVHGIQLKTTLRHIAIWLVTSIIIGGCLAQWV